ncbi:DUF2809 domain-containing protein [Microbacterium terricola]|uniref:DUF2809 domain-containing protein n=1 Tax=Microbacterium terricola TaxID=344163 RepID=A0ABM8DXF6_9MICO|nr:DUF2809 domain-containing protein [Microbacterium terricola]UYK38952.1 DUF2809 domain-containing protein [Microbacterium terricola]BDV30348.1 hypothetical protein Microterr_10080 [Microbacterium terricola]
MPARRLTALALLLGVIAAGLLVHATLPDNAASDIAGDALYAVAAYLAVVLIAPWWSPLVAGAVAAAWCLAIELFQLTGIPLRLGEVFAPAMLVLGTVFDPRDLVIYLVAVGAASALDAVVRTRVASRRAASSGATPR